MNQTIKANSRQTKTTICRLETLFLTLDVRQRIDHGDGAGDIQKDEAEDRELADEEAEDSAEGRVNVGAGTCEGVASSLGDLSMNGSGVLESLHMARSSIPMLDTSCGGLRVGRWVSCGDW